MKTATTNRWDEKAKRSPFIIAELSGNHNQSLERALSLIEAAAECGVDAVKFQTYTADTITLDCDSADFVVPDSNSPWGGRRLHELYQEAHTPWEWHEPMASKAEDLGLLWFSSPFDKSSVDFLDSLHAPAYKIASPEIVDLDLIAHAARTGKPIIMSTGMASIREIAEAVDAAREAGCNDLALLKCTTAYPAPPSDANLMTIPHLRETFRCRVGLSDHTMGIGVAVASIALGGTIIEKHFTLSRSDGGPDSSFSMEPPEMSALVTECRRAAAAIGSVQYGGSAAEQASKRGRRSLYATEDIKAGELLTQQNIRSVRPGMGLLPKFLPIVVNRRATRDIPKGSALDWAMIGTPGASPHTNNEAS